MQRNLDHYTVGLVGYTNAGKSTLFNRLTQGGAFAHDKLFATLSSRVERWELGGGNAAMLSDTVGFIRNLPHHLVASFRCTLEETVHSQLLIIIVDAADPNAEMQLQTVLNTLDEIAANDQPRIVALNKIDCLKNQDDLLTWLNRHPESIPLSAVKGDGLEELGRIVLDHMLGGVREVSIEMAMNEGKTIAFLEKRTDVLDRRYEGSNVAMAVRIGRRQVDQLLAAGATMTINGLEPLEAVRKYWDDPDKSSGEPIRVPLHERFHP